HLASVAAGLVLIVALILVLGWFLRRFNQGGLFNNSSIKIIATLPLGTRERLAVVDVGGQQLLLALLQRKSIRCTCLMNRSSQRATVHRPRQTSAKKSWR